MIGSVILAGVFFAVVVILAKPEWVFPPETLNSVSKSKLGWTDYQTKPPNKTVSGVLVSDPKSAFPNSISMLFARTDPFGYTYWKQIFFDSRSDDQNAQSYVISFLDAMYSGGIIRFYLELRHGLPSDALDVIGATDHLKKALDDLESHFAFESFPFLTTTQSPPFNTQAHPTEKVTQILSRGPVIHFSQTYEWLKTLGKTEINLAALMHITRYMFQTPNQDVHNQHFLTLSINLLYLGGYCDDVTQSEKYIQILKTSLSQVSPSHVDYPRVIQAFEHYKEKTNQPSLTLPPYQPRTNLDNSGEKWILGFDGSLHILQTSQQTTSSSALTNQTTTAPPNEPIELSKSISKTLFGLVGLEPMAQMLALDLNDFFNGSESRARILWGPPASGKTELAQRICGLRDSIPGLSFDSSVFQYVSGVDGKLEIKQLVDSLPEKSVIFIDEADKCLDSGAQMVTPAEATQLHHSILTHFSRKQLCWIFLGTFARMRQNGPISYDALEKTLGPELASRVDFLDWEFPAWTHTTLLQAVRSNINRRGLKYEDDAVVVLVDYCLRTGGGVRAFDNVDQALTRKLRFSGKSDTAVNKEMAMDFIEKLGFRKAA